MNSIKSNVWILIKLESISFHFISITIPFLFIILPFRNLANFLKICVEFISFEVINFNWIVLSSHTKPTIMKKKQWRKKKNEEKIERQRWEEEEAKRQRHGKKKKMRDRGKKK